jgi:hypothetical protein
MRRFVNVSPRVIAGAVIGVLVGISLVVGGAVAEGVVAACLTVAWFAGHVTIADRPGIAGRFASHTANLELVRSVALSVVMVAVIGVTMAVALVGWTRDTEGRLLVFALVGVAFLMNRDLDVRIKFMERWERGAASEQAVGDALAQLRHYPDWEVIHDWNRDDRRGNVDHAVRGPAGVFAIVTNSGRYRNTDLGQAVGNAIWLKTKWNAKWATAVVCVDDETQSPERKVYGRSSAWVIDRRGLVPWLLEFDQPRST